jgi:hypothetical protein
MYIIALLDCWLFIIENYEYVLFIFDIEKETDATRLKNFECCD